MLLRLLSSRLQACDLLDDEKEFDFGCCAHPLKLRYWIRDDCGKLSLHLIQELHATSTPVGVLQELACYIHTRPSSARTRKRLRSLSRRVLIDCDTVNSEAMFPPNDISMGLVHLGLVHKI